MATKDGCFAVVVGPCPASFCRVDLCQICSPHTFSSDLTTSHAYHSCSQCVIGLGSLKISLAACCNQPLMQLWWPESGSLACDRPGGRRCLGVAGLTLSAPV